MMHRHHDAGRFSSMPIAIVGVALFVIVACSAPSIWRITQRSILARRLRYQPIDGKYEDEDGIATQASVAAYSYRIQRVLVLALSVIGFVDSLVLSVVASQRPYLIVGVEEWLQFGAWVLLLFQAVALFVEPQYLVRFRLSAYGALSSLLLSIAIFAQNLILWSYLPRPRHANLHLMLTAIQLIGALSLLLTYSSVPRRPDVYRDEKIVDKQFTVSILARFGFSWPGPLLRFAATNNRLDINHLPEIDYQTRSKTLWQRFGRIGEHNKLWKSLFWSHKWAFISQGAFVTITSVTNFLPQIALLFILKALEERDSGRSIGFRLWILVSALGLAIIISSWLEAWLFFICFSRIGQPIFQQLAAVIFGKAMRRKDIKGVSRKTLEELDLHGVIPINEAAGAKGENSTKIDDDEDDEQKTRQSTINLVGVDSYRISNFATYVYIFPGTVLKLALAFGFLISLIGWIPLLAGLAIPAIVTPVNALAAKRYAKAQDDLMKTRDKKMSVVTEALQGIRQIKFSAFEDNWEQKILEVRRKELTTQWRVFKLDTTLIAIWILGPIMLAAVALAAYAIIHKSLSPSVAFTTVSVFEALEMTLAIIPEMITDYLDAKVSATRIEKYLDSAEKEQCTEVGRTICFQDATIAWPVEDEEMDEDRFCLRNLRLDFPSDELSVISGKTGSGKSLLLASILGESDILGGTIQVPRAPPAVDRFDEQANASNWYLEGALAFVAQIPWIENATIKDNILFGLPLDTMRYQKTLSACALQKDLEMLPDGELTDIGANGINLSGGQRARISFARALYSRARILVLDDVFSAVDANVGRQLFEEALTGELGRGRTRILATHHVGLCLPKTKYTVLLGDGGALHSGTVDDLRKTGSLKAILVHDIEEQQKAEEEAHIQSDLGIDDGGGLQHVTSRRSNQSRRRSSNAKQNAEADQLKVPKTFTEDEKREQGAIKRKIYAEYIRASGGLRHWLLVSAVFAVCLVVILGRSWWISVWTRSYQTETVRAPYHLRPQVYLQYLKKEVSAIQIDTNLWFYLGIYIAWSVAQCVIGTSRYYLVFLGSLRASKDLFQQLTYSVLRAPLRWLDTVPVGRILNRFTADFNMIDSRISMDLAFMMHNAMQVMSVIIAGAFVSPWMIAFALLLLVVCLHYARRYLTGAREVKRLESNAKSPIFELFGAALMGISTIRAFDKADIYVQRMHRKIDTYAQAYWHLWLFNRWMGFRLNMVGAVFATITAALIVSIRGVDASLAGFALSFALEYTVALVWALRQYANVELDMNAVERIIEYSNIPIEDQSGDPAPAAWPSEGRLEVADLVVGYAPDLPPVLKGLNFSIGSNQRIGVVGRTGAGKSSLTLALFRFLEAREGVVLIDGIDISKIRLQDVRSRLAIIPQDPVLFSGTVRSNLDAFDEHDDAELRDALERVHLVSGTTMPSNEPSGTITPTKPNANANIFRKLTSKISEGGLNLSQGQRQLLCLARAIVSRPKIMVLDEATSAVDMETDALIQRSIREEFQDSTLIVIAHRLSTIADFDKILVMGEGKVMEYEQPRLLMEKEGSEFRKMVEESGEREALEEIINGTSAPVEASS
jgi:ABC-type multidrug transport system fused ATPase/permease subunit